MCSTVDMDVRFSIILFSNQALGLLVSIILDVSSFKLRVIFKINHVFIKSPKRLGTSTMKFSFNLCHFTA